MSLKGIATSVGTRFNPFMMVMNDWWRIRLTHNVLVNLYGYDFSFEGENLERCVNLDY